MSRIILIESSPVEMIKEEVEGKKVMRVTGPFLMFDKQNRNKRVYPKKIMESAVEKYKKEYIDTRRALGEMNHPPNRISIDPERACILTESLEKDGNYYIGTAKVLSTPLGKLLENLLSDGVKIGVSSRGLGSTTNKGGVIAVKEDYEIRTAADVVFDPSVADAFVECLMEETEYLRYGDVLVEKNLYESREKIINASMSELEKIKLKAFQEYLMTVSGLK